MPKAIFLRVSATAAAVLVAVLLATVAAVGPVKAAFLGDNGVITFASDRGGHWDVYQMGRGGSQRTKLTDVRGDNHDPAWSADGTKIAFTNDQGCDFIEGSCGADIYRMDADGSNEINLTNSPPSYDSDPAWFPGSNRIAFRSDRSGNDDIYVMAFDSNGRSTGLTRLTTSAAPDMQPTVSPNGKKVAFASRRDGDWEIYVMKVAPESPTNRPIKLTKNATGDYAPDWSPGGQKIAFASHRTGDSEVFVMNADGFAQTNLTRDGAVASSPDFSPDGEKIAFSSSRDGDFEIWQMRANGDNPAHQFTRNSALDTAPDWQPLP